MKVDLRAALLFFVPEEKAADLSALYVADEIERDALDNHALDRAAVAGRGRLSERDK